ncbi:Subunit of the glycosylphosphatidylinositol transamidase complex-like protein [Tieghemiomyces parasiticus]|uniref:Subunit of the glycosylphosphatidylinositol transamidase complex-like protein n=1 Tax=Tieghemiomyces parasiticus TaxID=78921 RepID=A0A9W8AJN0_9FUNG|nr:Subunit of the glycosylphosphatidylinositol transamidase complex-like protein [Tieghemiomyces parasiticus]
MDDQHYRLFPRLIGQIIQKYEVEEFHLKFTQGHWDYERWGYPPEVSSAPSLELRTRLRDSPDLEERWQGFNNALSGLFCASINFIDGTTTSEPRWSFQPAEELRSVLQQPTAPFPAISPASLPVMGANGTTPTVLRHSFLARENVCTENLTPWIKLLPCQAQAGLAGLLNSYRLYDTHFHSMGIHVTSVCPDARCIQRELQTRQTLTVVSDRHRVAYQPTALLASLFDRRLTGACPLARTSRVLVTVPETGGARLDTDPTAWLPATSLPGHRVAEFDLYQLASQQPHPGTGIDLALTWPTVDSSAGLPAPVVPLTVHRQVAGHGLEHGHLLVTITNRGDQPQTVTYLDTLPWYLNVYFHTLAFHTHSLEDATGGSGDLSPTAPIDMYLQTSLDHGRPSAMELKLVLAPQSRTTITMDFDKAFLKYTEHPPDANRGLNVGSAILSALDLPAPVVSSCTYQRLLLRSGASRTADKHSEEEMVTACLTRLYTELFLVNLPTPDFSMPYNVIAFTCTVLAFFFGSMFNALIRGYTAVEVEDELKAEESDAKKVD